MKHNWKLRKDGSIDNFALSYSIHNGPLCLNCGVSYCEHCHPGCYDEECEVQVEEDDG